jgi:hypothetical protein
MIFASIGSFTAFAACPGDSHSTSRSRISGHFQALLLHLERENVHLADNGAAGGRRFSYEKDPSGSRPTTPASS